MNKKVAVVYESKTGNTKYFAERIAQELDCIIYPFKEINEDILKDYDTVIFGSRCYAGRITKLNSMIGMINNAKVKHFIIFATGASPAEPTVIENAWKNNLNEKELKEYPHFYFPAGLNYEAMGPIDRLLMKVYATVLKYKKKNSDYEREAAAMVQHSYDIKNKKDIEPLIDYVKSID